MPPRLTGTAGLVTVVARRTFPSTHRVYNLTVQGEHLYRVATSGVLVHNNGCKEATELLSMERANKYWGLGLRKNPVKGASDYLDGLGRSIDHMGFPEMAPHWAKQRENFFAQIHDHLSKHDALVIDLTDMPQSIKDDVAEYVLSLPEELFNRIYPVGF